MNGGRAEKKLNKTFKNGRSFRSGRMAIQNLHVQKIEKKMIKTSTEKPVTRKSKFTQYKWQTVHILQIAIRM